MVLQLRSPMEVLMAGQQVVDVPRPPPSPVHEAPEALFSPRAATLTQAARQIREHQERLQELQEQLEHERRLHGSYPAHTHPRAHEGDCCSCCQTMFENSPSIESLGHWEIGQKLQDVAVKKASAKTSDLFALSVAGGAFTGFACVFYQIVVTDADDQRPAPYGMSLLFGGISFALGILLLMVAGGEVLLGNSFVLMLGVFGRRITVKAALKNWAIVWFGNMVGTMFLVCCLYLAEQYEYVDGRLGVTMLRVAEVKCRGWFKTFLAGFLSNYLVCHAIWIAAGSRTMADKIPPCIYFIAAFVCGGYDNCIANMFFVPMGLLVLKNEGYLERAGIAGRTDELFPNLGWGRYFLECLIPSTVGNVVCGALVMGPVFWYLYLRKKSYRP